MEQGVNVYNCCRATYKAMLQKKISIDLKERQGVPKRTAPINLNPWKPAPENHLKSSLVQREFYLDQSKN